MKNNAKTLPVIIAARSLDRASLDEGPLAGVCLDGDCACPAWSGKVAPTVPAGGAPAEALQQVAAAAVALDETHTALLPANQAHGLLVLNASARRIWDRFARPVAPADVVAAVDLPADASQAAIDRLWALACLAAPGRGLAPVPTPADETLVAWLHVTHACNLRCSYCYVDQFAQAMDAATGQRAAAAVVRAARRYGYRRIRLKYAGGEPLLNFPRVLALHDEAVALAEPFDIAVEGVLLTNGVLLRPDHLDALAARGMGLVISLDGVGRSHDDQRHFADGRGSFESVERAIKAAQAHGLPPHLSITVTPRNAASLAGTVSWILDRGLTFAVNFWRDTPLARDLEPVHAREDRIIAGMRAALDVIAQRPPSWSLLGALLDRASLVAPHAHACGAGRDYLVIDARGQVAQCQMQLDRPVTTVDDDDPLAAVRLDTDGIVNPPVDAKPDCAACAWKYWCAGGCPLAARRANGSYAARSPNCRIYRALFPEVVRLEGIRVLRQAQRLH